MAARRGGRNAVIGSLPVPTICHDCAAERDADTNRCGECGSPRRLSHPELYDLHIAHIDCDAFYAAIEKRDNPDLYDKPVIVGGGKRGVVSAACYVARIHGVRSAMPMFKALKACPHAIVIAPSMSKYAEVGRQVREILLSATPLVEPLSIDEAFLDLSGTERVHGGSPAATLVRIVKRIETELRVTASVGLSHNKFLAKFASDMEKPRGFKVIGRAETESLLAAEPVHRIWGVGKALHARLTADGITRIGDLVAHDQAELMKRYGSMGQRLYRLARGLDDRPVRPDSSAKSVSSETTFSDDVGDPAELARRLWPLCERVVDRLKKKNLAGRTVTLKLKTAQFRTLTRSHSLKAPTQFAEALFRAARPLLVSAADGRRFRLIGVGLSGLCSEADADPPDLADPDLQKRQQVERAIDAVREKLGRNSIGKGRALP